jgi:hypothetical protein
MVYDQVDFQSGGRFAINLLEEDQSFLVGVLPGGPAGNFAVPI